MVWALVLWRLLEAERATLLRSVEATVSPQLAALSAELEAEVATMISDARFLAAYGDAFFSGTTGPDIGALETVFKDFAQSKTTYSQVRLLGPEGNELVRVNRRGDQVELVGEADLQNKSERYYFGAAQALRPGETYVSPLDLNVENGQVVEPWEPTLRVASPIYIAGGTFAGAILLNANASQALHPLVRRGIQLVNGEGFWLLGGPEGERWAFMFEGKPRFPEKFPEAWKEMRRGEAGFLFTDQDQLIAFSPIRPLRAVSDSGELGRSTDPTGSLGGASRVWYMVREIDNLSQVTGFGRLRRTLTWLFLGGLVFAAAVIAIASRSIWQRQRAAELVRRERTFFKVLLRAVPVPVYHTDRQGVIGDAKQAFARFFGVVHKTIPGKRLQDFGITEIPDLEEAADEAGSARLRGRQSFEATVTTAEGERAIRIQRSVFAPDGKVEGGIGAIIDLSHERQREVELERAKLLAEEASAAKSEFLAVMSHEIRTPMNGVIGMVSLLEGTQLSLEQRDFVHTIRTSGEALLALIGDILDFSKIESGHLELDQEPFSLLSVIEDAVDIVVQRAEANGVELLLDVDPALPAVVSGDCNRLRQVLVNLLGNAVKFTPSGEIVVSCSRKGQRGADELVVSFSVRDTGIGIPTERQQELFEPFVQGSRSTSRHYGGTGLGLAITKQLVEAMGGRIWLESEVGKGSKFHFDVAVAVTRDAAEQPFEMDESALRAKRVWVVDDNETNRRILVRFLDAFGCSARVFESGPEALACRDSSAPDFVLMDYQMPGMDGLEAARALARREGWREVRFLVLTSFGSRINQKPFAASLTKPVKFDQLRIVMSALAEGDADSSDSAPEAEKQETPGVVRPLRILVAEDNGVNQKVVLLLLRRGGYSANLVSDGSQAVQRALEDDFDVILMDVRMPQMDGIEATKRIRGAGSSAQRPYIIALTANAMPEDRELNMAAGMNDHLTKPLRYEDLMGVLERAWGVLGGSSKKSPGHAASYDAGI